MTRSDFVRQIAYEYAIFVREIKARHGEDAKCQPLDRHFAYSTGQGYVETKKYTPRVRHLNYSLIAQEARKALPRIERLLEEVQS